ncbi:hypothetical protein KIN20_001396 [Parelaphostrongylus tenuis]|uniref:Uncharacterized protein n=1 Tax=Parelaphostrongylus tenuis TaxID=148309 RepID=A0AAD5MM47_PARTN|nr:hypothetical protein KIN20_001396 [Parelaphostrongylus tenuis]
MMKDDLKMLSDADQYTMAFHQKLKSDKQTTLTSFTSRISPEQHRRVIDVFEQVTVKQHNQA